MLISTLMKPVSYCCFFWLANKLWNVFSSCDRHVTRKRRISTQCFGKTRVEISTLSFSSLKQKSLISCLKKKNLQLEQVPMWSRGVGMTPWLSPPPPLAQCMLGYNWMFWRQVKQEKDLVFCAFDCLHDYFSFSFQTKSYKNTSGFYYSIITTMLWYFWHDVWRRV